tara:strand:+ start:762 stop:1160 length:399 start_codon:yes stop_codon:yes gene_type:complete
MTRETSIDCFNQIKLTGLVSKRRLEVLEAISKTCPCTTSEAISAINTSSFGIGSRFTELRDMNVIYEVGSRKCSVTGRNVIEWDLTGNMPVKHKKKIGKPRNINKVINYLIAGMDIRGWNSISKDILIKLKE